MWQELLEFFFWAIGGDRLGTELAIGHMIVRAIIVFIFGLLIIRVGKRRFYGARTPLDLLMGIIVGSVLSRAINGTARFTETIAATATLVLLHWLFATLALHYNFVRQLSKGVPRLLIEDGAVHYEAMRVSKIGEGDLLEALHLKGFESPDQVKRAWLERSGQISVIPRRYQERMAGSTLHQEGET
jgi:uncharacterized membrane protein YcaP (DUF421 family)